MNTKLVSLEKRFFVSIVSIVVIGSLELPGRRG
jgi:hypothetical protein